MIRTIAHPRPITVPATYGRINLWVRRLQALVMGLAVIAMTVVAVTREWVGWLDLLTALPVVILLIGVFKGKPSQGSRRGLLIVWLAATVLVLAVGAYKATGFYGGPSKYVGAQRHAGQFVHTLSGAEIVYGGQEVVKVARLLTANAFVNALKLKLIDGSSQGVPAKLDANRFARLQAYEKIDFWLGGYHYQLFVNKGGDAVHRAYFFIPPGEWKNLIVVVPATLYEKIK